MASAGKLLTTALRHHNNGHIKLAEHAYRKLLRLFPGHAEGLHGLGLIAHQRGYVSRARSLLSRAVKHVSCKPYVYYNLGVVLSADGESDRAIAILTEGVRRFEGATAYNEDLGRIHNLLSDLHLSSGNTRAALGHARYAIHYQPENADYYKAIGIIQIKSDRPGNAIGSLMQAITLQPGDGKAYNILGRIFHDAGLMGEAEKCYKRGLAINPQCSESCCNLGSVYLEADMTDHAIRYLQCALDIAPDNAEAHVNLGVAMLDKHAYTRAGEHYRAACRLKPGDPSLRGYWAHALLLRGIYSEGWVENEWGLRLGTRVVTAMNIPYWDGTAREGLNMIVLSEQGIGDQIMYFSCMEGFLGYARPDRCIVQCDPRLIPLFKRSLPDIEYRSSEDNTSGQDTAFGADVKIATGSLPRYCRKRLEDFPRHTGYLVPDQALVCQWKQHYKSLQGKYVIGIAWRGGRTAQQRHMRSTSLFQWIPVLSLPDTAFINLQYGECKQELADLESLQGMKISDWPHSDPLTDLDNYAAKIAALDLVISIDNSTAHMAGALGVPAWTLLPFVPDWRWMRHGHNTPWYPGMRLFRQTKPGDWAPVFGHVAKSLGEAITAPVNPRYRKDTCDTMPHFFRGRI